MKNSKEKHIGTQMQKHNADRCGNSEVDLFFLKEKTSAWISPMAHLVAFSWKLLLISFQDFKNFN